MAEAIRIDEGTWRFEDGGVRFFLLEGTEKALLIDSGMTCPDAKAQAEAVTRLPLELLNTHGDYDHTSGNKAFGTFYMSAAEDDYYHLHEGGEGTIIPLREGDVIDLGDRPLEIFETPGHTPGSIAILDVRNRALIAGDSIQDGPIFMYGEGRDMEQYLQSLKKVQAISDRFDVVYPSHSSFPVDKELVGKLIEGAQQIIDGTAQGEQFDLHGTLIWLVKFPYASFLRPLPESD